MAAADNLHPTFGQLLTRAEKEASLRQRARVVWLYGLSGSGKSTLANSLERRLHAEGFTTQLLDGDNVRTGLNRGLGFSDADRAENIRRVAEVAKLSVQAGVVVITAFITPQRALRVLARGIIGADDFLEVYVSASFEACARRDPKGIYAKANAGQVRQFTGRDSIFEPPAPDGIALTLETETDTPEQSLEKLYALVAPKIRFS